MTASFLLDTHIVIRYLLEPRKLSREQIRILNNALRKKQTLALSAMSLLEIAMILSDVNSRLSASIDSLFEDISENPMFQVLPVSFAIATEVARIGPSLRDPADRAIVATARVHRLRLLTSDQRIIASQLVAVVD